MTEPRLPEHVEHDLIQLDMLLDDAGQGPLLRIRIFMLEQEALLQRARDLAEFVERKTEEIGAL